MLYADFLFPLSLQGTAQLPEACPEGGPLVCVGAMEGAMRLKVAGAPVFSLSLDSEACGSGLRQVRRGSGFSILSIPCCFG
jgi:hypothetical protein